MTEQIRDVLLRAIDDNEFPEGRLPPEGVLATQLGVSRGTVRMALQTLVTDGIVSRRPRHGTVINRHVLRSTMRLNRLNSFASLVEHSGYRAATEVLPVTRVRLNATQSAQLDAAEGAPALQISRVVHADAVPVIAATDIVLLDVIGPAGSSAQTAATLLDFLELNAGVAVDYSISSFVPCVATDSGPERLELPPGTPYIQLHEAFHDREHRPLAVSVVSVVDRLIRLTMLRRGR